MIKILVKWEDKSEIENAINLMNELVEYMRDQGLYTGTRTVNMPKNTFGINLREFEQ